MSVLNVVHTSPGGEDHTKQHQLHEAECLIFDRGFGSFFQSGDFSDVMLVTKETGMEYHLHKIILAFSSKYFANYFDDLEKKRLSNKLSSCSSSSSSSSPSSSEPSTPTSANPPTNPLPLTPTNKTNTSETVNTNTSSLLPSLSNMPVSKPRGLTIANGNNPNTSTHTPNFVPIGRRSFSSNTNVGVPSTNSSSSPTTNSTNSTNNSINNSTTNSVNNSINNSTTNGTNTSSSNSINNNNTNNNNNSSARLSPRPTPAHTLRRTHSKISTHSDDDEEEEEEEREGGRGRIRSASTNLNELLAEIHTGEKDRVELGGPFTQYFHHVVKYMYEGNVEFTSENAIPLLAMADFYQIKELRHAASDHLLSSITRENALMMLQKAIHFNAEAVANKCITVICKNFNQVASLSASNAPSSTLHITHHIPTSSTIALNSLPVTTVIRILKQNNLAAASEFVVYKTVCAFIEANSASLSPVDITALFETVRFPWLTYQQLMETEENQLVPRHLLTEALFMRLKPYEQPTPAKKPDSEDLNPSHNSRMTPRAAYAISLEYHSDFDEHGLFYYIGTNAGKEEWSNPGMRGRVRVTCSSQEKGSIVDLVGRTSTECWSMDVPSSWVMINLGSSRSLVPNYYTLRHGGNSKADGLRNWTLQGSNDSKNWSVLIRHVNDSSLNGNYASASWPIPNCTQAYRFFRVLQNGRNSSNHNFLSLSGIEFYGDLYETRKEEPGSFG